MADKLLVGDKELCSFNQLSNVMRKSDVFPKLITKWRELASSLGTSGLKVMEIEGALNLSKTTLSCIPSELLMDWRARESEKATLKCFCDILRSRDLGLDDMATYLLKHFVKTSAQDSNGEDAHDGKKENYGGDNKSFQTDGHNNMEYVSVEMAEMEKYEDWPGEEITEMTKPKKQMNFPDDGYHLPTETNKGQVLIINIRKYTPESKRQSRFKGHSKDTEHMEDVAQELGFHHLETHSKPDEIYTRDMVKAILGDFKRKCGKSGASCLIIFIGCHGNGQGVLEMSDGSTLDLYPDVVYLFNNINAPKLKDIPKIFIFQACRDFEKPSYIKEFPEKDGNALAAPMQNTMVCFATIPGYAAFRYELVGSAYIYTLVNVLRRQAHGLDLEEMLKLVSKETWKLVEQSCRNWVEQSDGKMKEKDVENYKQYPMFHAIGDFKKLYFNLPTA